MGFVEHQYNRNSIYQQVGNFFIGIGPILSGVGSLMLAMYILLPESYNSFTLYLQQHITVEKFGIEVLKMTGGAILALSKSLFTFKNLIHPLFWIFLVISICISSHMALSKADIQGSAKGLLTIFFLLFFINIVAGLFGIDSYYFIAKMAEYNAYILAFSSIAVLFSFITLVLSYILYRIAK